MTRTRLNLTRLEDRTTPASFGNPWPDARHLTVSFAPDGTAVDGAASDLFRRLGAADARDWQLAALRAFQTWAVHADIDLRVVTDGGQAFDAAGTPQGDRRFGDVRIGARLIETTELALGSPYDPMAGTHSGDVRLNSYYAFGPGGYDLYSVLLHEAGHVFGLGHSDDPASPMYDTYGARGGLTAGDVARLQAIYGPRTPDRYEGAAGNDAFARATPLALLSLASGNLGVAVTGDVTTAGDRDVYAVNTTLSLGGLVITLHTSDVSLLAGKLTVYDASGRVVAAAAEADPLSGNVTLRVPDARPLARYYVAVEGATGDAFGVGGYRLDVQQLPPVNSLVGWLTGTVGQVIEPIVVTLANNDLHLNDSILTATLLPPLASRTDGRFDYSFRGAVSDGRDVDYYRVAAPAAASTLTAHVWGVGGSNAEPRVRVVDARGNAVAAEVLVNDGYSYAVQVRDAVPGAAYFVKVESRTGATGEYVLGVEFAPRAVTPATMLEGTGGTAGGVLRVDRGQLFHFILESGAATLTIADAAGRTVFTLTAGGETATGHVWLGAGRYSVRVSAGGGFRIRGRGITDPVGPRPVDTTESPYATPERREDGGPEGDAVFWAGGNFDDPAPGGAGGDPIAVA